MKKAQIRLKMVEAKFSQVGIMRISLEAKAKHNLTHY